MIPVERLKSISRRLAELISLLCDPAIAADPRKLRDLGRERSQLEPIVEAFGRWESLDRQVAELREALQDPEIEELAREELPALQAEQESVARRLAVLLLPSDPNDERNTMLEIRSGTGGEEAALFAADLLRMYTRFAEHRGWKVELLSLSEAAAGGLKEAVALVSGTRVFSVLKYEAGVHRVQRVPATEAQGRIHTSTATVAVLPEADDVEVNVDDKDLRIDIAAAGGPGGQGVNTTNSAVQVTHLPSGIVVKCQDERSQLKNKARALKILKSRLLDVEQRRQAENVRDERRTMVGTGERSEKIRTYNFPQNRVTDHRIGLTVHELDRFMEGELDQVITAVAAWHEAKRLQEVHETTAGHPS